MAYKYDSREPLLRSPGALGRSRPEARRSWGHQASRTPDPLRARRGFTLAESLTASVVLAASVIGIAGTLSASHQQSAVRDETTVALQLARELMEEVASRPMDPAGATNAVGWPTVTNRVLYDTLDDFNNYSDTSTSIRASDGTVMDLGAGKTYTRTVTVTSNARPTGLTGTTGDFMLVTVTAQTPHRQSLRVSQLFTRATVLR